MVARKTGLDGLTQNIVLSWWRLSVARVDVTGPTVHLDWLFLLGLAPTYCECIKARLFCPRSTSDRTVGVISWGHIHGLGAFRRPTVRGVCVLEFWSRIRSTGRACPCPGFATGLMRGGYQAPPHGTRPLKSSSSESTDNSWATRHVMAAV